MSPLQPKTELQIKLDSKILPDQIQIKEDQHPK